MISIGDNISAVITIGDDLEVNSRTFYKLIMNDSAGGSLPIMELTLIQQSYTLYSLLDSSPIVSLKIGTSKTDQFSVKYRIKDFNYSGDKVVLTGIIHLPEFMAIGDQVAYNDTLSNIIAKLTSIEPVVSVATDDKQIWIRDGGTSQWDFINQSIMHGWISDSDCLLHGISIDGKLHLTSVEGVLGTKEFYSFSNVGKSDNDKLIRYSYFKPESDKSLWEKSLVRRSLPVFHIDGRSVVLYKDSELADATDLVPLPQLTDCGNCHANYYQGNMNYIAKAARLSFNSFFIEPHSFLDLNLIKLLDKVAIESVQSDKVMRVDPINGAYAIVGRSVVFTTSTNSIRYELARPGFGVNT